MIQDNPEYIEFKKRIREIKEFNEEHFFGDRALITLYDVEQAYDSWKRTAKEIKKDLNSMIASSRAVIRTLSDDDEQYLKSFEESQNKRIQKREDINEFMRWVDNNPVDNLMSFLPSCKRTYVDDELVKTYEYED